MFVIIKDNCHIENYEIENEITYKGIHIYKKNKNYYIELKNDYHFIDNTKTKQMLYGKYDIGISNKCYDIQLYVYQNSKGINEYGIYKTINFAIANVDVAHIKCLDPNLKDYYLIYKNGYLYTNFDVLVNGKKYDNQLIKYGDIIEYLGIKIFYYDEFIYINSFNIENKLEKYKPTNALFKYSNINELNNYYIPNVINDLQIDQIQEYVPIKKTDGFDFIKSLLPNLIMCISMSIMALINYNGNLKNSDANILSFILMPISMALTSIFIPIVFIIISNKKYKHDYKNSVEKYIVYLNDYKEGLNKKINEYIDNLNSHYFKLFDSKKMIFYLNQDSDDFMKLSIGKISISKKIVFKKTNIKIIDDRLKEIEKLVNNIDNYPLFLDLKKQKIVSIVCKPVDKRYYFDKYLLELAYKHHYDDLNICIYSKNNGLFDDVYNLPHLFLNNQRLTINSEEQLQTIDQCNLNKPLVLFAYDKFNCIFHNDKIHLVYFSKDICDIAKNSSVIVEHKDNTGYIYDEHKTKFTHLIEYIDFKNYFAYLGRFKHLSSSNRKFEFKNIFADELYTQSEYHSLKACFAYDENHLVSIDLHESKQGPHGLIGGSTGSGKSELIISMLLSMCIQYSPEYLSIVLIDYKGGGIQDSLSYKGISIPHIIASISNLENNALERLIIALHNECSTRQLLFKELSKKTNLSIMNLDDYIDNNRELVNIAHLLIVIDEFAELKKENPEQIRELISISRIGRSLGIHLILATQKPAGVIDDQIWSNSRFKIALKVFDEKDSNDLIKCNDAAYLSGPGSFLMKIDNSLIKGQSIYCKNDAFGNDEYKVSILDSKLNIIKTYKKQTNDIITVASYYCEKIIRTSIKNNCKIRTIKYMPNKPMKRIELKHHNAYVFGEIDDYINNRHNILSYDTKDSLLIYSTRKNEINSILNSLNENKRNSIVIGSKTYEGSFISDSLVYDNNEDIEYLFEYLLNNKNNNLTLVIEDINCLLSYDDSYFQTVLKLIKLKEHLNLSMVLMTSTIELNFKLTNAFRNKIVINVLEQNDIQSFFGCRSKYKGNSYFCGDDLLPFVPINIEQYVYQKPKIEKIVKHIPDTIEAETKDGKYLLGYDEKTKEAIYFDDDIILLSYDDNLLNKYLNNYPKIIAYTYRNSLKIDDEKPILWLGKGIFEQRLFVTGRKDDIGDNQGIIINNNRKILIRSLNNV